MIHHRLFSLLPEKGVYTWVYPLYLIYHLFCLLKNKKMYTWAYPLHISFIIVCLLLEQRDVNMIISVIYHTSFIIACFSIALRKKRGGGKNVYMSISCISHISFIIVSLSIAWKMYTWVYTLYIIILWFISTFVSSIAWTERKKSVYMSKSLILYIIYHCLSVAWKKAVWVHSPENWTKRVAFSRWNKNLTKSWNFLN